MEIGAKLQKALSKVPSIPGLNAALPSANRTASEEEKASYLECQRLARDAAQHVASLIQPGWTEKHAATLLNTYLADHGVGSFFHKAFAWFGERTRFEGITHYADYSPTTRTVREGEIFILDVAPIFRHHICDIGYTASLGPNADWEQARNYLKELRELIPQWVNQGMNGESLWQHVDAHIKSAGYDNIHEKYPFSVLGHRVHRSNELPIPLGIWNFGWQSFWALAGRGLFGQLLGPHYQGKMTGLWAVEPHVGGNGFGAKFEEILVVDEDRAYWLAPEGVLE